ncbi:MAG: UbiD family decarboxylase, partial [archaeon GBS-70-058]|nr:UbiD family decarboxylase [Candidatus Culexarchaeum nevadense]
MNIREFLRKLEVEGKLIKIKREVSVYYEAAEIMATLNGKPVYLEKIKESNIPVAGNLLSSRQLVAMALNVEVEGILHKLNWAMNNLKEPQVVDEGVCQEVVEGNVDLTKLPILKHMPKDRGRYVTSAVCILRDPQTGIRNSSFHRLLLLDEKRFVARIVEGRGTDTILKKSGGEADVAICIGSPIQVMIAAATSLPHGVDELGMANALEPTPLVKCKKIDLEVPAETEIVLEGRITKERAPEGPFLDITETYDMEREQPIIEVKYITHRRS